MSNALVADDIAVRPVTRKKRVSWKNLGLTGATLAVIIAAALYGVQYVTTGQYIESTDDAYVGGNVTGLAPKVNGLIARIAVTDNQYVHAGDLLVQLDDRDYRAALAKAQAQVAGDRASLANLDATTAMQLHLIDQAAAEITAAKAQILLAGSNQNRYRRLAASNAGSEQDAQTADSTNAQAIAAGAKARAAFAAAQAQLAVIATQKQIQQAALAGALADLTTAQLNLGYTQLRAPIDGYIGNRSAQLGAYATIGAQLVSIVPAQGLWVDANFKEDQLAGMHPGQPVTIVADVLPGRKITGHVASLAPATGAIFSILPAENATGNFTKIVQRVPVRILLDGTSGDLGLLRPGLSVTADVNTK
jgi:membrane fusion protein, multidrug efflux system